MLGKSEIDVCKEFGINIYEFVRLRYTPEFGFAIGFTKDKIFSDSVESYFQNGGKVVYDPEPCVAV